MERYDLIVIGGGAGGLVVAAGSAGLGAKVALIDKGELGGDCLWTGCVPTKSLIQSAKIVHAARKSQMFGLEVTGRPKFEQAKQRLNESIASIQQHDDPERFKAMGIHVYRGYASFQSPHEILIDDDLLIYGKRIVVATGSRPLVPPIKGLRETGFLTNETALKLAEQPKSLLVVGGGPIGLEFAQSFARFGTEVTVVEMAPDLLVKEDVEIIPYIKKALEDEGLTLITGAKVVEVKQAEHQKEVIVESNDGQTVRIHVDEILVSSGRMPNTDRLHLENAGINTDRGYIPVNACLQTKVPHIYAVGDVNGLFPFTHAAGYEGKIVVSNAVFGLKRKVDYNNLPWVTYTDPEVFHLGYTEKEAREKFMDIRVYKTELREVDRFVADHDTEGLIKIITDRKGRILGAHAVGSGAGDFMQEVVFAKQYGHKIGTISIVIHPYPTHAGGVQRAADQYWREKLFAGWLPKLLKTYIRWFR
jgi:pyruvate/2-oxoglutarate dehydrogenase complex dihydrolipoamide dehydrogenase (E3) component